MCTSLPVRLGRLFALGAWGDAVQIARSARDLRAICLLAWALDPTIDVDGKRRASQLGKQEFEAKIMAYEKRLEELDDDEILAGLDAPVNVEQRGELIIVDVLEKDGTWDQRNSGVVDGMLGAMDRFSLLPGARWKGFTAVSIAPDGSYALVLGPRGGPAAVTPAEGGGDGEGGEGGEGESDEDGDDEIEEETVALPKAPLSLYRAKLAGPYSEPPALVQQQVDGAPAGSRSARRGHRGTGTVTVTVMVTVAATVATTTITPQGTWRYRQPRPIGTSRSRSHGQARPGRPGALVRAVHISPSHAEAIAPSDSPPLVRVARGRRDDAPARGLADQRRIAPERSLPWRLQEDRRERRLPDRQARP